MQLNSPVIVWTMRGRDGELTDYSSSQIWTSSLCSPAWCPLAVFLSCLPSSLWSYSAFLREGKKIFFHSDLQPRYLGFQNPGCLFLLPPLCTDLAFMFFNTCICYWTFCSVPWPDLSISPSFLCICVVYVYVVFAYVLMLMHMYVETRGQLWAASYLFLTLIFESGFLAEPAAH